MPALTGVGHGQDAGALVAQPGDGRQGVRARGEAVRWCGRRGRRSPISGGGCADNAGFEAMCTGGSLQPLPP